MSRRRNTLEQELPRAQKAPAQTTPEILNAGTPNPEPERAPPAVPDPTSLPQPPKGQYFPTRAELDAALTAYMNGPPGVCPICGGKIGRGAAGHLSKCLRISKFKTASMATS